MLGSGLDAGTNGWQVGPGCLLQTPLGGRLIPFLPAWWGLIALKRLIRRYFKTGLPVGLNKLILIAWIILSPSWPLGIEKCPCIG